MDKNSGRARLPSPPSTYLRRMFTDTVNPDSLGLKFAIEYYGIDHVMYGTDYPCWDPATALRLVAELGLSGADSRKLLYDNARRILSLDRGTKNFAREAADAAAAFARTK
jgi:aminocarboxymuconate-semialdehyde decarboxylase